MLIRVAKLIFLGVGIAVAVIAVVAVIADSGVSGRIHEVVEEAQGEYCKRLAMEGFQLAMKPVGQIDLNEMRDYDNAMKAHCPEGAAYWLKQVNDEQSH